MPPNDTTAPGVKVTIAPSGSAPIAGVGTSTAGFLLKVEPGLELDEPKLITSYEQFTRAHWSKLKKPPSADQKLAAESLYGFFLNGGTRCYIVGYNSLKPWQIALGAIGKIDEIALVVAPGAATDNQKGLCDACAELGDRFALLDGPKSDTRQEFKFGDTGNLPPASKHAAYYYPWIKIKSPIDGETHFVPPSGHIAGVLCRPALFAGFRPAFREGLRAGVGGGV